jgi:hypothetical protein
MSILTLPTGLQLAEAVPGQRRYDMAETSDVTGDQSARLLGPPRWHWTLRSPPKMLLAAASDWDILLVQLRGRVNYLAVYDLMRPAPLGTMRGDLSLASDVAIGATSMQLQGAVGTVAKGDWFQIGQGLGTSQLVKATASVSSTVLTRVAQQWKTSALANQTWQTSGGQTQVWSATGLVTIPFEAPARQFFRAGTIVTWDKPVAYFKSATDAYDAPYAPGSFQGGFAIDLTEAFA